MSCIATGILVFCLIKWSSVTVDNDSPIHEDYDHPDDQTQPTFEMTPGFKPFTVLHTMLVTYNSGKYKIVLSKSAFGESNCTIQGIQGIEIYPLENSVFHFLNNWDWKIFLWQMKSKTNCQRREPRIESSQMHLQISLTHQVLHDAHSQYQYWIHNTFLLATGSDNIIRSWVWKRQTNTVL